MSHTPTPWEYHTENRGHYLVTRSYPKLEGKVVVVNEQSFDNEDDVFRIVACVNACEGRETGAT